MRARALFWLSCGMRNEAGIVADVHPYDLRHSHDSHAIVNGENLLMAGQLLGHRYPAITNLHAHIDDATLRDAAECVTMEI